MLTEGTVTGGLGVCGRVRAGAHLEWVFSTMEGCIQARAEAKGSSLRLVTGPLSCGRASPRPNIPGGAAPGQATGALAYGDGRWGGVEAPGARRSNWGRRLVVCVAVCGGGGGRGGLMQRAVRGVAGGPWWRGLICLGAAAARARQGGARHLRARRGTTI